MVEVVQDLLDHVTYAGGVGRRRVDAVRGIGAGTPAPGDSDCAVIAEDPSNPKGPQIVRVKDLMFHEVLDKPFDEKEYHLQLEEFAYRGERIVKQVDQKLGEVQQMTVHDVLKRSKQLPHFLKDTNDELQRSHLLICQELDQVWHIHFEPFFYPSEEEGVDTGWPGGWLDLDDMFLTARLLTRYVAELVALIGAAVSQLPDEALDREHLIAGPPDPGLQVLVLAFSDRVPWIGATLDETFESDGLLDDRRTSVETSADEVAEVGEAASATGQAPRSAADVESPKAVPAHSPLNDAITSLNTVLTVHLNHLVSDLHRTMYQTFVRMCAAYVRWKRAFADERSRQRSGSPTSPQSPSALAARKSLAAISSMATLVNLDRKASIAQTGKKPAKLSRQSTKTLEAGRHSTRGTITFESQDSFLGDDDDDVEEEVATAKQRKNKKNTGEQRMARPSIAQERVDMLEIDLMD